MKSFIPGLFMSTLLILCQSASAIIPEQAIASRRISELVIQVHSTHLFDFSLLPMGTKVISIHEPYNIIVLSNDAMLESELMAQLSSHPDIKRIEMPRVDPNGQPIYPTGTVILDPKEGLETKARNFCYDMDCTADRQLTGLGWFSILLPDNMSYVDFEKEAANSNLFDMIAADEIITAYHSVANDPFYTASWHISQVNDKDIDADEAWSLIPPQAAFQSVAVIDGHGFDTSHPDMAGQWSDTYNAVDQTTNVLPISTNEKHGTACAGIPGALTDNAIGVSGLGNNFLKVQAIRIGYNPSTNGSFSTSSLIQADAINRAMLNSNTATISMSFGSSTYQTTFYNAILSARTQGRNGKGLVVFGSTGNSGSTTWTNYPASYTGVIAVGSSTSGDNRSSFSNYSTGLTLSAPGSGIPTTDVSGANGYSATDYTNFSGTSAACPVAASAGAMMITANPALTENQVKQILAESCEKVGNYSYSASPTNTYSTWSIELGYGRINMKSAVELGMQSGTVSPDISLSSALISITSATVGQNVTISANQTISPANGVTVYPVVEYRWSTDQIWSSSDIIIGTDASTLGGGLSSESESINYTIPAGAGTRYVLIKSDAQSAVTESNENNNITVLTVTVAAPTVLPDVNITNFAVDDNTPFVGQVINISCTQIISSASTTTNTIILEYRYSTDAVWSATDILIGSDTSSIGSVISTSPENISYAVPAGTGSRFLLVRADINGAISESNESNNTYILALTVSAPQLTPDVTVNQLTATNTAVTEGQSVTVLCQQVITNAPATPVVVTLQYRWSTDLIWSETDALLGTSSSNLGSSTNSETESITFNIPMGVGSYYLLLKADALNAVTETNESNLYSINFTVSAATSTPDVFIDAISVSSATVTPGQLLSVDCFQNVNIAGISAVNVFLEYRWATSPVYSSSFPIVGVDYSSLGAGDPDDPENHSFTIPSGTGLRYVMVICDSGNSLTESNEANNVIVIPVNVVAAITNTSSNGDGSELAVIEEQQQIDSTEETNLSSLTTPLSIYPNPASDHIFYELPQSVKTSGAFELFTMDGSLVMNNLINKDQTMGRVDISLLKAGVYLIHIRYDGIVLTERLVIAP